MKISIGGYNLRNIENFKGREGHGYSADLYYYEHKIASLEDYADGGEVNARFYVRDEQVQKKVLSDMKFLIETIEAHPDSLSRTFLATPYSALMGFGELLLELKELVKQANSAFKKAEKGTLYVVGQLGSSWFQSMKGYSFNSTFFRMTPQTSNSEAIQLEVNKFVHKNKEKHGDLIALAILEGQMNWNLTLEEYVDLYTP